MPLIRKSVAQIITFWRPGSHDWSWADEYADLINTPRTAAIRERIGRAGDFGFADHDAPVLLGSDGRVWDGHHRIVLAIEQEWPYLWVDLDTHDTEPGSERLTAGQLVQDGGPGGAVRS